MAVDFPASPTIGQKFVVGIIEYEWDGTKWFVVNELDIDVSDATATATDVLASETFYAGQDPTIKTGTIASKTAETFTPGTTNQTISEGQYLSEDQTVLGDADLVVSNIKTGVTLFDVNGTFTADATATAGDILNGETAYVNGLEVTGTIPSKTAETFTPGTSNQTISSGQYLSGTQTILGDANLIPENIVPDVTIFGVTGVEPINYIEATGGTTTEYNDGGKRYRSHTFNSSGNFVVSSLGSTSELNEVDYLIIAGGGAGGMGESASAGDGGGGGGAGGFRSSVQGELSGGNSLASSVVTISPQSYSITVGAGGTATSNYNSNSAAGNVSSTLGITSSGGGFGGTRGASGNGGNGGSGGGAAAGLAANCGSATTGGSGTSGQGFNGAGNSGSCTSRRGNGGGGAGAAGVNKFNGGHGGSGIASSITGSSVTRAGGGGGGGSSSGANTGGSGGAGGGARGHNVNESGNSPAGTTNTGGGGGGGNAGSSAVGGNGGSGIVIIRYEIAPL